MPKRLIDGDAIWKSNKVLALKPEYRAEYVWLLPLGEVNACFEYDPLAIWANCYAMLRPGWTMEEVRNLLEAFEAAKLLFKFEHGNKQYGFWVGMEKHLPKPSEREKYKKHRPIVPPDLLAKFLSEDIADVQRRFSDVVASSVSVSASVGLGNGNGLGTGSGNGIGAGQDTTPASGSNSPTLVNNATLSNNRNTSNSITPDPMSCPKTAVGLAQHLFDKLSVRPEINIPEAWLKLWSKDFQSLLDQGKTPFEIVCVINVSQTEGQKKYYVRSKAILDKFDFLLDLAKKTLQKGKIDSAMETREAGPSPSSARPLPNEIEDEIGDAPGAFQVEEL